jgi:hypothetical protein
MYGGNASPEGTEKRSPSTTSADHVRNLLSHLGRSTNELESPRGVSAVYGKPTELVTSSADPKLAQQQSPNGAGFRSDASSLVRSDIPYPALDTTSAQRNGHNLCGRSVCRSRRLLQHVADLSAPLRLLPIGGDFASRASALTYNAIYMEVRDMFRIIDGLIVKASENALVIEDIYSFYCWFEGFHGIVTSIFDVQEDILFSWLERVGAIKMENALAPKRRKTKQERTKEACWDILELKIQFQRKSDRKVSMDELVLEMSDEAQHLASRVLAYIAAIDDELPSLIAKQFDVTECSLIEAAVYNNLRSSEQGNFALAAYARGILDGHEREQFLNTALGNQKKKITDIRLPGQKLYRKFQSKHVDLADKLASTPAVAS